MPVDYRGGPVGVHCVYRLGGDFDDLCRSGGKVSELGPLVGPVVGVAVELYIM